MPIIFPQLFGGKINSGFFEKANLFNANYCFHCKYLLLKSNYNLLILRISIFAMDLFKLLIPYKIQKAYISEGIPKDMVTGL